MDFIRMNNFYFEISSSEHINFIKSLIIINIYFFEFDNNGIRAVTSKRKHHGNQRHGGHRNQPE